MSAITTHVLDTSRGRPAAGIPVLLEVRKGKDAWKIVGRGKTDAGGRVKELVPAGAKLAAGIYRFTFNTSAYREGFYPEVVVVFAVKDPSQHYHVPLLLSPYGYTTYRGS